MKGADEPSHRVNGHLIHTCSERQEGHVLPEVDLQLIETACPVADLGHSYDTE